MGVRIPPYLADGGSLLTYLWGSCPAKGHKMLPFNPA